MLKFEKSLLVICAIFLFALLVTCMNRHKTAVKKDLKIIHTHAFSNPKTETLTATVVDPYKDWDQWCENIFKIECHCEDSSQTICDPIDRKTKESKPCDRDRTGREQVCVRPHWARRQGINFHECRPRPLGHQSRKKRKTSQEIIVQEVCQQPKWAIDLEEWGKKNRYGNDVSKLCWHLPANSKALKDCKSGNYCDHKKLSKYLSIIAKRESTWDNETTHVLNRDQTANVAAYSKAKKGKWYEGSKFFGEFDRWSQGYGWYGHNAALNTFYWDTNAPPEILCRQVESTEVHLRKMRKAFNKLFKKYEDTTQDVKLSNGESAKLIGVTWYDLHRATSSGKLTREDVIPVSTFVSRAKTAGLDPFETVNINWLGIPIPKENQNQIAEEIRQKVIEYFNEG